MSAPAFERSKAALAYFSPPAESLPTIREIVAWLDYETPPNPPPARRTYVAG